MFKKTFLLLYITLATIGMANGSNYKDKGLYGKLSYQYYDNEYINNGTKQYIQNNTKSFMLGYSGNIYSPRLLNYNLEGIVNYNEINTMNNNSDSLSFKSDTQDYNLNMNFLKDSRIPFTVFLSEQNSIVGNSMYETDKKSLNGNIKLNQLKLTYGVSNSNTKALSSKETTNSYENYNTGASYKKDDHNINITYYHTEQSYNQKYEDYNLTTYRDELSVDDRLSINYKWDISKELKFNSSASQTSDSDLSLKSTNANFRLQWQPGAKYGGSIFADAYRYEYEDINQTKSIIDILSLVQNFRYKVLDSLSINESSFISSYNSSTTNGTSSNISLDANHVYNKKVFNDATLQISTRVGTKQSLSVTNNTLDNNTDRTYNSDYLFNISESLSKPFPSIYSILYINSSYNYNLQTKEKENLSTHTFNAASSLSSVFYTLRNNLKFRTSINKSKILSTTSNIISDDISTSMRLGIRGKVNFKAGVNYNSNKIDDSFVDRASIYTGAGAQYRFFHKLMFNVNSNVNQDINTDYLAYSLNSGLTYAGAKTSLSIKFKYNKTEYDSDTNYNSLWKDEANKIENANLRFNVERRF